ncbi:FG-GAP-like repeat-containing protein [Planctomycetota bacterium]
MLIKFKNMTFSFFFVLAIVLSLPGIVNAQVTFNNEHSIDNIQWPHVVVASDVDGDGDTDVISGGFLFDGLVWWENDGTGSFVNEHDIWPNDWTFWVSICAIDLDNDGDEDVIGTQKWNSKIVWFENDGSGDFGGLEIIIGEGLDGLDSPCSVYAIDLDTDGDVDVLATDQNNDDILWWENDGSENFGAPITIDGNFDDAFGVFAIDLDQDGNIDVLSASRSKDLDVGEIAWWKNNGSENFTKFSIKTPWDGARSVFAIDMDGDGDVDVLGAASEKDSANYGGADEVIWWENDGSENWTEHLLEGGINARDAYAVDLDKDGDVDVLTAALNDNEVAWWENDGSENFTKFIIADDFIAAVAVCTADLDNDGDLDVLAAANKPADKISWFEQEPGAAGVTLTESGGSTDTSEGILTDTYNIVLDNRPKGLPDFENNKHLIYASWDAPHSVTYGDLDMDGDMDVIGIENGSNIMWWENDGNENWTFRLISSANWGGMDVYVTDLDSDGDLDVIGAFRQNDAIIWWENDGTPSDGGWLDWTITDDLNTNRSVFAIDIDNDGDMDVIGGSEDDDEIAWFENDGNPSQDDWTKNTITAGFAGAFDVFAIDIDSDGDSDVLATSRWGGEIGWFDNDGSGNFGAVQIIDSGLGEVRAVFGVDLDSDGDIDVIGGTPDDDLIWWENDGSENFSDHTIEAGFYAHEISAADIDNDGDIDVLAVDKKNVEEFAWWENDGTPVDGWTKHIIDNTVGGPDAIVAVDIDGDGDLDILGEANAWWNGEFSWWENKTVVTITVDPDVQTDLGSGTGVAITKTFNDRNWKTAQTVTVAAVDDQDVEGPHTSTITHTAVSADANYNGIGIADITANIADDDPAIVVITESGGTTDVTEGALTDSYEIVLNEQPSGDITIIITPDLQVDVGAGFGIARNIVFTTLDYDTPREITVTPLDDDYVEHAHTSLITHTSAGVDPDYDGLAVNSITVNITDDDVEGIVVTESDGATNVIEGTTTDSYTIVLTGKPLKTVAINITTDGKTIATPNLIVFGAGNWNVPQTVTVSAIDNESADGPLTSTISHDISTIDIYFGVLSIDDIIVNITDDEMPGLVLTESGGATDIQEGSTTDSYTIVLTSEPADDVTVTIVPDAECTVDVNPLTFTNLNWDEAQTVTVTAVDDADSEGDHTATISHTVTSNDNQYDGYALGNVIANVTDNEPFAVAGDDYSANPGLLYLDGSDSVGITALSYSWAQTGGSSVTILGGSTATPSFYAYGEGAYTFELTVTDEALRTDTDTIIVTVQNVAPVAVATPEYWSMEMGENKQLSGSSSYDANGTAIDSYIWNLIGANNPVANINTVLNSAAIAAPVFTPTAAGVYNISLQVGSSGQSSALASITLVVIDFNNNTVPPVAYAGPGRTVPLNTLVTLYGHDSLDADSMDEYPDLEFTWRQISGPAVALSDTTVPQPTFTPLVAGWYQFGLTVRDASDDNIFSEEDTVTVLAFDKNANYPPAAVPELKSFYDSNSDNAINTEETFTLTATNSSDPDGDVLTVTWQQISGPGYYTILPSTTATEITYTALAEGTYTFRLIVNDGNVDSAPVDLEIYVVADNTMAPVAKAYADGCSTLLVDASQNVSITLDGTQSTGTDGESSSGLTFQWRQLQGPTVEINNSTTSIATFAPTISRSYEFQLIVTDPYGVTATDNVMVSVSTYHAVFNPTGNGVPKPVVTAPVISLTFEPITLNASNSVDNGNDPDGVNNQNDGLIIFWVQTGGPRVMLDTSNPFMPTFTPQVAGTYTFVCYVDDGSDISPGTEIIIAVEDPILPAGVIVTESPDSMKIDEGEAIIYSIALNSQPGSRVIISVNADYQSTVSPDILTFTSANWNYPQYITVTTKDDNVPEPNQASIISHTAASSDEDYDQINISNLTVAIIDNDIAGGGSSSSVVSGGGGGGGGCFIATAAYGSYTEKHVMLLREFRDHALLTNTPGKWFVEKYYQYSPSIAARMAGKPVTKALVRLSLLPLIALSWYLLKANIFIQLLMIFLLVILYRRVIKRRLHT